MFSDSEIAAKMKLQRDIMRYTITYGIAHQFQKDLINSVISNEVTTRYFSSVFLNSAVAIKLKEGLTEAIGDKNLSKIFQISMDGPVVNFRMLDDLKKYIEEKNPDNPILLNLGSSGLHNHLKLVI